MFNKKILLLIMIFLFIPITATANYSGFNNTAYINITNPSSTDGVQVLKNFSYSDFSGLKSNWDDIRFTQVDGTNISYWIESKENSIYANIWLKLPANENQIKVLWGNESATSASNGTATFEAFFDKNSTTGWTTNALTVTTSGDYLRIYGNNGETVGSAIRNDLTLPSHYIVESKLKTVSTGLYDVFIFCLYNNTQTNAKTRYVAPSSSSQTTWYYYVNGVGQTGGTYSEGVEYKLKIDSDLTNSATGNSYYRYDLNGNLLSSATGVGVTAGTVNEITSIILGDYNSKGGCDAYISYMLFRKYVETEPTLSDKFVNNKIIKINNYSTNDRYQILKNFSYSDFSGLKSNWDDIRFTKIDGSYIDYWIEEKVDGEWAKIWLDLEGNEDYIYVVWGNENVINASDITKTFLFADDFSKVNLDTSKWNYYGTNVIENGTVKIGSGSNGNKNIKSKPTYGEGYISTFYAKLPTGTQSHNGIGFTLFDGTQGITNTVGWYKCWDSPQNALLYMTNSVSSRVSTSDYTNAYHKFDVIRKGSGVSSLNVDDNVIVASQSNSYIGTVPISARVYDANNYLYVDYVHVRPYLAIEPTLEFTDTYNISEIYSTSKSPDVDSIYNESEITYTVNSNNSTEILWYVDGTLVETDNGLNGSYTYTSDSIGDFNITAVSRNSFTTDSYTWNLSVIDLTFMHDSIIYITNSSSTDGVQVLKNFSYSSFDGLQADWDDIRFKTINGTNIDYWIESKSDGQWAKIWIELPANEESIKVLWGNSEVASGSNGTETFEFFDGFDGSSVGSDWTSRTGSGSISVNDGVLTINGGLSTAAGINGIRSVDTYAINNYVTEMRTIRTAPTSNWAWKHTGLATSPLTTDYIGKTSNCIFHNQEGGTEGLRFATSSGSTELNTYPLSSYTDWIIESFYPLTSSSIYKIDRQTVATHTSNIPNTAMNIQVGVGNNADANALKVDWILVRKYVAVEPTLSNPNPYEDFTYSEMLNVYNPTSINNYQVMKNFTTSKLTGIQNDFDDIRFNTSDNLTLDYWIEEKVDGEWAKIWIEIPTGYDEINVIWGNESAISKSNGTKTFIIFDDFNDSILDSQWTTGYYVAENNKFFVDYNTGYNTPSENNGLLIMDGTRTSTDSATVDGAGAGWFGRSIYTSNGISQSNFTIQSKMHITQSSGGTYANQYDAFIIGVGQDKDNSIHGYFRDENTNALYIGTEKSNTKINNNGITSSTTITNDWKNVRFDYLDNGNCKYYIDDEESNTFSLGQSLSTRKAGIAFSHRAPSATVNQSLDWILIREYSETEPQLLFSEELIFPNIISVSSTDEDNIIFVNQNNILNVSAENTVNIEWYKDGSLVETDSGNEGSYTFNELNVGTFNITAIAVNQYGNDYHTWNITVNDYTFINQENLTILNSSSTDGVQVLRNFNYSRFDGLQSNWNDIRFTTIDNETLNYWIENKTDGVSANIWIKLPANDSQIKVVWGNSSASSKSSITDTMQSGLRYFYYDGMNFETYLGTDIDTNINHSWSSSVTINGNSWENQAESVSIKWKGWILPDGIGNTIIYSSSDDGQRLYLNNNLVIDNWQDQGTTEKFYTYNIQEPTVIEYQYYENSGGAAAMLGWDSVNNAKVYPIPNTNLVCRNYVATQPEIYFVEETNPAIITEATNNLINNNLNVNTYGMFNITSTTNENIKWYVNGTLVETDIGTTGGYLFKTRNIGDYNITAISEYKFGNDQHTWNISVIDYTFANCLNLTVNNPSSTNNVQVLTNFSYSDFSGLQADWDDIRFTDIEGNYLDYYLENKSNSEWANIWIELPANESHLIALYGNASATSMSDPYETFVLYDGFDGDRIDYNDVGEALDYGIWNSGTTTATYYNESGITEMRLQGSGTNSAYGLNNFNIVNKITETRLKYNTFGKYGVRLTMMSDGSSPCGYIEQDPTSGNSALHETSICNPSGIVLGRAVGSYSTGTWYNAKLTVTNYTHYWSIANVNVNGNYALTSPINDNYCIWTWDTGSDLVTDWIRVREYVSVIPTIEIKNNRPELIYSSPSAENSVILNNSSIYELTTSNTDEINWYLNDVLMQTNNSGTNVTFEYFFDTIGVYNITAIATNNTDSLSNSFTWNTMVQYYDEKSYWIDDNELYFKTNLSSGINKFRIEKIDGNEPNGIATFIIFDDFNSDTSSDYTSINGASIQYDSVNKYLKQLSTSNDNKFIIHNTYITENAYKYEAKVNVLTDSVNRNHAGLATDYLTTSATGYRLTHLDSSVSLVKYTDGAELTLLDGGSGTEVYADNRWINETAYRDRTTGELRYIMEYQGTTRYINGTDTTHTTGSVGLHSYGSVVGWDDIRVSKYNNPEPTAIISNESTYYEITVTSDDELTDYQILVDISGMNILEDDSLHIISIESIASPEITEIYPNNVNVITQTNTLQEFNVTIDQIVNVDWYQNGTLKQTNESVTFAEYIGNESTEGMYNLTAIVSNVNGTDSNMWNWDVIASGTVNISSTPSNASVYINNTYKGVTPYSEKLNTSVYNLTLTYPNYNNYTGQFTINTNEETTINQSLTLMNGSLNIQSIPNNANIYLNDILYSTTNTTLSLESGNYSLKLNLTGYDEYTELITINANETLLKIITLNETSEPQNTTGEFVLNVIPNNAIAYLNDTYYSTGNKTSSIEAGNYLLNVTCDGYYNESEIITIIANQITTKNIILTPKNGSLNILTTPSGASIYLDDEFKGTTPLTVSDLIPNAYSLLITMDGYTNISENINIPVNSTLSINRTLEEISSEEISYLTVTTVPENCSVYLDNSLIGYSPITNFEISSGNYYLEITKTGYYSYNETFNIENNETKIVDIELTRPEVGTLNIISNPNDTLYMITGGNYSDEYTYTGHTPDEISVIIGNYNVSLYKEGYNVTNTNLTVEIGQTYTINETLTENINNETIFVISNENLSETTTSINQPIELTVETNNTTTTIIAEIINPNGYEYYYLENTENNIWNLNINPDIAGTFTINKYYIVMDNQVHTEPANLSFLTETNVNFIYDNEFALPKKVDLGSTFLFSIDVYDANGHREAENVIAKINNENYTMIKDSTSNTWTYKCNVNDVGFYKVTEIYITDDMGSMYHFYLSGLSVVGHRPTRYNPDDSTGGSSSSKYDEIEVEENPEIISDFDAYIKANPESNNTNTTKVYYNYLNKDYNKLFDDLIINPKITIDKLIEDIKTLINVLIENIKTLTDNLITNVRNLTENLKEILEKCINEMKDHISRFSKDPVNVLKTDIENKNYNLFIYFILFVEFSYITIHYIRKYII